MALAVEPLEVESPEERAAASAGNSAARLQRRARARQHSGFLAGSGGRRLGSPAVEVLLRLLAPTGALFLRAAGGHQHGLGAVRAQQHVVVGLFVPLEGLMTLPAET